VAYFNYLGSMITNDARRTRDITSGIVMARAALKQKAALFTSKLDLNLRKKLKQCYTCSITLCGAVIWTLEGADQIAL